MKSHSISNEPASRGAALMRAICDKMEDLALATRANPTGKVIALASRRDTQHHHDVLSQFEILYYWLRRHDPATVSRLVEAAVRTGKFSVEWRDYTMHEEVRKFLATTM